jgi:hypothetical protein
VAGDAIATLCSNPCEISFKNFHPARKIAFAVTSHPRNSSKKTAHVPEKIDKRYLQTDFDSNPDSLDINPHQEQAPDSLIVINQY